LRMSVSVPMSNICSSSYLLFLFQGYVDHRHLHSFPTRRSSDLGSHRAAQDRHQIVPPLPRRRSCLDRRGAGGEVLVSRGAQAGRSEEHTSELQSRENLVCRLLLEKKKKNLIFR